VLYDRFSAYSVYLTGMSVFREAYKRNQKFYYKIGSVETEKAWIQPTAHTLTQYFTALKRVKNYEKYELFLVGGAVNHIHKTFDVDIVINGNSEIEKLEKFLHEIHNIGLNEFRLLIDAKWLNEKPSTSWKPKMYEAIQFGKVTKRIGENEAEINLFEHNLKLTENLVKRKIYYPNLKTLKTNNKFIQI